MRYNIILLVIVYNIIYIYAYFGELPSYGLAIIWILDFGYTKTITLSVLSFRTTFYVDVDVLRVGIGTYYKTDTELATQFFIIYNIIIQ